MTTLVLAEITKLLSGDCQELVGTVCSVAESGPVLATYHRDYPYYYEDGTPKPQFWDAVDQLAMIVRGG